MARALLPYVSVTAQWSSWALFSGRLGHSLMEVSGATSWRLHISMEVAEWWSRALLHRKITLFTSSVGKTIHFSTAYIYPSLPPIFSSLHRLSSLHRPRSTVPAPLSVPSPLSAPSHCPCSYLRCTITQCPNASES
jgi:hypothetical protein